MSTHAEKLFRVIRQDLALIEEELLSTVQSQVKIINDIGTHLIKAGGKRLRPALYLLCAYDGIRLRPLAGKRDIFSIAVCLELIHMATLVHDDVIDNSMTRRGKSTANSCWGNQTSVLAGDYLFAKAISKIAPFVTPRELKIVSEIISVMCEGEIIQHGDFFNTEQTEQDYLKKTFQKTANFIASACELGAIAANFTDEQIAALRQYGNCLGMAFQITDDILDITASSQEMGKPTAHDICQGVITLPVIRALETSSSRVELKDLISQPNIDSGKLEQALEIIRSTDAVEYSYAMVRDYLKEAGDLIPDSLSEEVKATLLSVIDFVELRRN